MKNFKLLLATTAILSTGLVIGANSSELTASIGANIHLYKPMTVTSTEIWFPQAKMEANKYVEISPDGVLSGNAEYIKLSYTSAGTVILKGMHAVVGLAAHNTTMLIFPQDGLDLYAKTGDSNQDSYTQTVEGVTTNGALCGNVTFTQSVPTAAVNDDELVIKYGGRFTMDPGVENLHSNSLYCYGSTTVTALIIDQDQYDDYGVDIYTPE